MNLGFRHVTAYSNAFRHRALVIAENTDTPQTVTQHPVTLVRSDVDPKLGR